MKTSTLKTALFGYLATTLLLTACAGSSGGGSNGSGFTPPNIPDTLLSFGTLDPQEVALSADAGAGMGAETSMSAPDMIFGVQATSSSEQKVRVKEIVDEALLQVLTAMNSSSVTYTTGVTVQDTAPCNGDFGDTGNIVFTGQLADVNSPTTGLFNAGDKVTMDISGCGISTGGSVTGNISFTFDTNINATWFGTTPDHSGCTTPTSCIAGMTVTFNNFGATDTTANVGLHIHGGISMETTFDTASTETSTIDINSLWVVLEESGTEYGLNLRNYHFTGMIDTSGNYTLDGSYELGANFLGGYINVAVNSISGNDLDPFASSGNIVISGANNNSITITYGVDTITLDIDNDGIVGTDFSLTGTWADFDTGTLS